jgi:hypothetical protein
VVSIISFELLQSLFYPGFLTITFILTRIFVPREKYKKYFVYGFLVGGLGDIIVVSIMQNLLGFIWFKNQGIFEVLGHMGLSPPSWTVTVMIFLWFLPTRRYFLYPYVATWAAYSIGYAAVVRNLNLYNTVDWLYPIPAYFIFLGWWSFAAWLFIKYERQHE